MPSEIVPSLCVVPVVGIHDDGSNGPFLGTGVFVGDEKTLITRDHVTAPWDGQYGISDHEDKPRLYDAEVKVKDTA